MAKDIIEILKENKIRVTKERKVIISILSKSSAPLSPADIFLQAQSSLPTVNLTTVYRNLDMLENLSLVKRVGFNRGYFSYELVSDRPHHHHLVCKQCGKVENLENISENFIVRVANQTNFRIEDHNLEFFGLCETCKREGK